jgi:serine/threonine protein kinase
MISQFFEGELLSDFVKRHRGKRLPPFEALHLVYAMACGLEQIHRLREYHGDLHEGNVLVMRQGIFFNVRLLDFYNQGPPSAARIREDAVELVRLLYETVGGRERYATQPVEIKRICRGMRRDLIERDFATARHVREFIESFEWKK